MKDVVELEGFDPEMAWSLMIERFGGQCAGWLVGNRDSRRMLHRQGAIAVRVPKKDRKGNDYEAKPWFRIAIDMLKMRQRWSVVAMKKADETEYRIRWNEWRTWVR